jgi:prophage antirepressor-like protein
MVSESGIYAILVHHCHAENRELRRWVTHEVVPCLREGTSLNADVPSLSQLQWPELSACLLNWQAEPWIRLRDMPRLLPLGQLPPDSARSTRMPWWRQFGAGLAWPVGRDWQLDQHAGHP